MKKRLIFALIFFLLFSTYKIQNDFKLKSIFPIKKIMIENNEVLTKNQVKDKLLFLYESNLFFLNTNKIKAELNNIDFIASFEIKKIYPNKLNIKILEKKPVAILYNKDKKFYLSENIEIIDFVELERFKDLPLVYGDKEKFKIFFKDLKKINFPINIIKKYFLYESNRWDLEIQDKKIIKLPISGYIKSLENFNLLKKNKNFEKYKIFDYRINNQLILR